MFGLIDAASVVVIVVSFAVVLYGIRLELRTKT